jgi:hypothetical protein
MRCKECGGEVNESDGFPTKAIANMSESEHVDRVHFCIECGQVYWPSGRLVFDQIGDRVLYVDEVIVHRGKDSIDPGGALIAIETKNIIEALRKCPTVEKRYERLMKFFPESIFWGIMESRWLVYQLYIEHGLDFGVCKHYSLEGDEQYCSATGIKGICNCVIPQKDCVIRSRHDRILDSSQSPTNV